MVNYSNVVIPKSVLGQLQKVQEASNYSSFVEEVERVPSFGEQRLPEPLDFLNIPEDEFEPVTCLGDITDFVNAGILKGAINPAGYVYCITDGLPFQVTDFGSYRGSYDELMFEVASQEEEKPLQCATFVAMLEYSCNGGEFYGYKGGEFYMDSSTLVYADHYGNASGNFVNNITAHEGNIVMNTKYVRY